MKKLLLLTTSILVLSYANAQVPALVEDVRTGAQPSFPNDLTVLGSELYFSANNGSALGVSAEGNLLFRYTPSGGLSAPLTPLPFYQVISQFGCALGVLNDKLYFTGKYMYGSSLYGTYYIDEGGAAIHIIDSNAHWFDGYGGTAAIGSKLYGVVYNSPLSASIGYIDASNHFTVALPIPGTAMPMQFCWNFTAQNGKVYFVGVLPGETAHSDVEGLHIYDPVSNTISNTSFPGATADAYVYSLLAADDGKLYFSAAYTGTRQLYVYDPTTNVVTKLTNLNTGSGDGVDWTKPNHAVIKWGNAIYFDGCDGSHGYELMKYDLTSGSVSLVKDINGSAASSYPDNFLVYGGKLYFAAENASSGRELWVTDGTSANTVMVADLNPGTANANPTSMTYFSGDLYFAADNGVSGTELYKLSAPNGVAAVSNDFAKITLYPNPGSDNVNLKIETAKDVAVTIRLCDPAGRELVKSDLLRCHTGSSFHRLPLTNLTPGVYQYQVISESGSILSAGSFVHN